jgi:hypothetical protein
MIDSLIFSIVPKIKIAVQNRIFPILNCIVETGYYFIQALETLVNVSAYIFAAFFTGSMISLKGLNVGVLSKKLSNAFPYIFPQRA